MDLEKIIRITQNKKEYDKWVKERKYKKAQKRFHKAVEKDLISQARKGINFSMTDLNWEDTIGFSYTENDTLVYNETLYWNNKGFTAKNYSCGTNCYITIRWEIEKK